MRELRCPDQILTVILSDYGPLTFDEPIIKRSVRIKLTNEQMIQLTLRSSYSSQDTDIYERISACFLEDEEK